MGREDNIHIVTDWVFFQVVRKPEKPRLQIHLEVKPSVSLPLRQRPEVGSRNL